MTGVVLLEESDLVHRVRFETLRGGETRCGAKFTYVRYSFVIIMETYRLGERAVEPVNCVLCLAAGETVFSQ